MKDREYKQSQGDHALFIKHSESREVVKEFEVTVEDYWE